MKTRRFLTLAALIAGGGLLGGGVAQASLVTVDNIIYQGSTGGTVVNPALLSGTVDITASGNTLTILLKNTSLDGAFVGGGAPALMLLTGVGLQLPGVDIVSGTVEVNGGSTALNFDGGQSTTDIANQWGYVNGSADGYNLLPGAPVVDSIVSSMQQNPGQVRFAGAPPVNIDGPDYGAVSAAETEFGSSQAGVRDTIKIVLTLSGTAPSVATIDGGNVILAFGSPDAVVPEPSTYLAGALLLVPVLAQVRRWKRNRVA